MNWRRYWNSGELVQRADFCRQVGRTFRGVPYSQEQLTELTDRLVALLRPATNTTLLDLACGNGLVTSRLAASFSAVTAVDFSSTLIATAQEHFGRHNVHYMVGDALEVEDKPYDRVLVSGAWQYFDTGSGLRLLDRLNRMVPADGCVVLGDVLDRDRIWSFYRGVGGRVRYALDVVRGTQIGHWWPPAALEQIAHQAGWTAAILYQPTSFPNHYFRYDAVLEPRRHLAPASLPPENIGSVRPLISR